MDFSIPVWLSVDGEPVILDNGDLDWDRSQGAVRIGDVEVFRNPSIEHYYDKPYDDRQTMNLFAEKLKELLK